MKVHLGYKIVKVEELLGEELGDSKRVDLNKGQRGNRVYRRTLECGVIDH